ncbi:TPA: hypothetical protein QDZ66_001337 [Pluralibacter gergoviae]|nr:hypothetical protein [Pluralibacter gergoviae]HDS1150607.1 hypothetical protein [Pluralibacter gergoviae]
MKYVFIEKHQAEFIIKAMCWVLRVVRSGWYVWRNRHRIINAPQRFRHDCDSSVHDAFLQAKQRYGAPRLAEVLRDWGLTYNVKTVASGSRRQRLRAKA